MDCEWIAVIWVARMAVTPVAVQRHSSAITAWLRRTTAGEILRWVTSSKARFCRDWRRALPPYRMWDLRGLGANGCS